MNISLFCGSANPALAQAVADKLALPLGRATLHRFPDGELHVQLEESVRGRDVYLVQPTSPPVAEHLLEVLLLADACRRAGAARLTGVIPYFGYARQDRRASGREPVGARLIADVLKAGGLQRVVAVDLHTASIEGFFPFPLEHLSAVPLLAEAVLPWVSHNGIIVSPDLGAVKLAERYAHFLDLPMAIVHKSRISGEEVEARGIVGEVSGRSPVVVDDMISTGGTVEAAVKAVLAAGAVPEVAVVASHALLVSPAAQRMKGLPISRFVATDSVAVAADFPVPLQVVSLGPLLAEAVQRLNQEQSLSDFIVHA
ncbi:MAG TPA: ribose-phosphate pyrophosphokinase [Dehalococcoidia bacterium]|nr:ribose-phosphate pyrophosphokinase [Dehalococcoidia bacterium]